MFPQSTYQLSVRLQTTTPLDCATGVWSKRGVVRHPGIEPGPHRWQRRILTTELMTL